ncbi:hypothetical protein PPGU19_040900 [Paraburkholderia sp. PGU19]|uniref:helix-turn-helix domain-containing protein n=1 Tax=Paraburkholderia sp. PGU19 TaxID=2735434 RepID=UPI0015DA6441|nr:helix-turn-helix transcriptional regulator [Paraburkholderia sp. PGU19]BCF99521.1 hypothetical protein PPGU19_040900 [Paraburkholderia sp. PGU19]
MDYSVKTLSQLRPVLRGFRKAAGLTQAMLAERLGITQQSYAQFEADPAAAGVERLFKVLRLLNAGITLSQDAPSPANAAPVAKMASSSHVTAPRRTAPKTAPKTAPRKPAAKPATGRTAPAVKAGKRAPSGVAAQGARTTPRKPAARPDTRAAAGAPRTASASKKREQW